MKDIRELNFWQTLKDIPNRAVTMLWKLLGVKGVVLAMVFYFVKSGTVTGQYAVWIFAVGVVVVIGANETKRWLPILGELKKIKDGGASE